MAHLRPAAPDPYQRVGLILFNLAAVLGMVALDLGYNSGDLEYREWPWPIDDRSLQD